MSMVTFTMVNVSGNPTIEFIQSLTLGYPKTYPGGYDLPMVNLSIQLATGNNHLVRVFIMLTKIGWRSSGSRYGFSMG